MNNLGFYGSTGGASSEGAGAVRIFVMIENYIPVIGSEGKQSRVLFSDDTVSYEEIICGVGYTFIVFLVFQFLLVEFRKGVIM